MAASYPIHQCDLLGSYMYTEPSKEDASCSCNVDCQGNCSVRCTYRAPARATELTLLESTDLLPRDDMTVYHVLAVPASLTMSYMNAYSS